jgi:hypothetical protein
MLRPWLGALLLVGCGLRVSVVDKSVQAPSNIALYMKVSTFSGAPVAKLRGENFEIKEDNTTVAPLDGRQMLLTAPLRDLHRTMLLLDLSGSTIKTGSASTLRELAGEFVDRLAPQQQIGVYGFDGKEDLIEIAPFSNNNQEIKDKLRALDSLSIRDSSTNLYGAIKVASEQLDSLRKSGGLDGAYAGLVVFTDGTDQAKRIDKKTLKEALKKADISVFTIGLGQGVKRGELRQLGREESFYARETPGLAQAFRAAAVAVEEAANRYYILSYCAQARRGGHNLTVRVKYGSLVGRGTGFFYADGFEGQCDPQLTPRFTLDKVADAPKEETPLAPASVPVSQP